MIFPVPSSCTVPWQVPPAPLQPLCLLASLLPQLPLVLVSPHSRGRPWPSWGSPTLSCFLHPHAEALEARPSRGAGNSPVLHRLHSVPKMFRPDPRGTFLTGQAPASCVLLIIDVTRPPLPCHSAGRPPRPVRQLQAPLPQRAPHGPFLQCQPPRTRLPSLLQDAVPPAPWGPPRPGAGHGLRPPPSGALPVSWSPSSCALIHSLPVLCPLSPLNYKLRGAGLLVPPEPGHPTGAHCVVWE